jgi:hypothetical protein
MVRGEIKAGVSYGEIRGKAAGYAKVDNVWDFMRVRRPVSGLTR